MQKNGGYVGFSLLLAVALVASTFALVPFTAGAQVQGYQQAVLASEPTAYWTFDDGLPLFDIVGGFPAETSGDIVTDSPLPSGRSMFDGFFSADSPSAREAVAPVDAVTVEYWFSAAESSSNSSVGTPDAGGYLLSAASFLDNVSGRIVTTDGVFEVDFANAGVSDGEWHHLTLAYSAVRESLDLFVDGSLVDSTAASGTLTYDSFYLRNGLSGRAGSSASIDEVAVYNRSLTATEVAAHFGASGAEPTDFLRPDFDAWHLGDVHVHSAGDTSLDRNQVCREEAGIENTNDDDESRQCAEFLMDRVFDAAEANGVEWFILAEHGTWLGMNFLSIPFEPIAQENSFTGQWNGGESQFQFELLTEAAAERTAQTGIRALMGQELGTAFVCDVPSFDGAGHFSNYWATSITKNLPAPQVFGGIFGNDFGDSDACDELQYVESVDQARGWGGVNHPNSGDHTWDCWFGTEGECGSELPGGVNDYARSANPSTVLFERDTFAAVEVVTSNTFWSNNENQQDATGTQEDWDLMLLDGRQLAATGGSDAHTNSRAGAGNGELHNRNTALIGQHSRTYANYADTNVPNTFTPLDERDPARRAIYEGRTIASNGPLYIPQVNGAFPGNTNGLFTQALGLAPEFSGDTVTVRVDWPTDPSDNWSTFLAEHDNPLLTSAQSAIDAELRESFGHTPTQLSAFVGSSRSCGVTQNCPAGVNEYEFDLTDEDRSRGWAEVEVPVFDYSSIFIYTAGSTDIIEEGVPSDFYGAVSSPIYLTRDIADLEPGGGTDRPPIFLRTGFGDITAETLLSSDYIDPSGIVVDQNGQPVENVDIELLVGFDEEGPFEQVPNGSVLMSPNNRQNPVTSTDGGFNWEVLPGIYKIRASKVGCVSAENPSSAFAETPSLVLPPGVIGIELGLDCTPPVVADLDINISSLDGLPQEGEVVFGAACRNGEQDFEGFGSHTLDIQIGRVDIPNLPVGQTCVFTVEEVPAGVLIEVGESASAEINEHLNSIQLFVGTGATTDEFAVSIENSEFAPTTAASIAVSVNCNDGSEFEETIAIDSFHVFSPIVTGATCTVEAIGPDGNSIENPVRRVKVVNFGPGNEGEPIADNAYEWDDQFFVVTGSENSTPVAVDDSFDASLGDGSEALELNVLVNDTDPDGNIDPARLTIVQAPSLGEATIEVVGDSVGILYRPLTVGVDTLTYQICDSDGACDTAQVQIVVDSDGGGDAGSLSPCSLLAVDSFGAGPWFFTFQVRNTTSDALDFEFVIPDANYQLTNLIFNGSSQNVTLNQVDNGDGTFEITVSGTLPAFQSVGGQQPNGFQGALTPTNGTPQTNCATPSPDNTDGGGDAGSLPPCSLLAVDSFGAGPWFFTFQVRNTTSDALDFEFVIPDANYQLTNLIFNGSSQNVTLNQVDNGDGTFEITVSGTLPAFQSVGGQQPNGFQGALTPTNGTPQTNCAPS